MIKLQTFHTCPIYTNRYDSSNRWSIGTNGMIGTNRQGCHFMVLLVDMHLIKGTLIIFSYDLAGYRAIQMVHWYQWYDWYQ